MIVRTNKFCSREDIVDAARWIRQRVSLSQARGYARRLALSNNTIRGRDFWFAVTEILGGDTKEWRQS